MESLKAALASEFKGELLVDEPLARYTTYRIGGPADLLAIPASEEDVALVLAKAKEFGLPVTVIGSGSNLLVSDLGIRGVVIRLGRSLGKICFDGSRVLAQAGTSLPRLAKMAADRGLSGLEWGGGVPGTVGGAVAMNAGAHGGETSRVLKRVHLVDRQGQRLACAPEEMAFSYRRSGAIRQKRLVVVSAEFQLEEGDPKEILERMKSFAARRRRTQPLGVPSSGSVFKNPPGDFAGRLIEAAQLKGARIGGAQISTVHGNFIVNTGGARAEDVYNLIRLARTRVYEEFGVKLELEVELVGWDSD